VERRTGTLPPGSLESGVTTDLITGVGALLAEAEARGIRTDPSDPYEVEVVLEDGTRVVGSVPLALAGPEAGPARVRYSRPKPTFVLQAWVDLMALAATDPDRPWRSVFVSRGDGDELVAVADLRVRADGGAPDVVARHALGVAVRCYRAGMREPLPLFPTLSKSVADGGGDASAWRNRKGWGDGQRAATALFFGGLGYRDLMDLPARATDPDGSGGRVERWARYLWGEVAATCESAG
jgi:exodeoxyribonuclease V gamma subunit